MNAEEMFKELGYTKQFNKKDVIYFQKLNILSSLGVVFTEEIKEVYAYQNYKGRHDALELDMKLLKAINKQIEELGW